MNIGPSVTVVKGRSRVRYTFPKAMEIVKLEFRWRAAERIAFRFPKAFNEALNEVADEWERIVNVH